MPASSRATSRPAAGSRSTIDGGPDRRGRRARRPDAGRPSRRPGSPPPSGTSRPTAAGASRSPTRTLTVEQVAAIVRAQAELGTARLCPTLITAPFEAMRHGVATIAAACEADPTSAGWSPASTWKGRAISERRRLPGGPSARRRPRPRLGRVPSAPGGLGRPDRPDHARPRAARGDRVHPSGPAAGRRRSRSATPRPTPATLDAAVDAGATLSTHLGNGIAADPPPPPEPDLGPGGRRPAVRLVHRRRPPPRPRRLRVLLRAKAPSRCILVSDASPLAGLPPGATAMGGRPVGQDRRRGDAVPGRVEPGPRGRRSTRSWPPSGRTLARGRSRWRPIDPGRRCSAVPEPPARRPGEPANLIRVRGSTSRTSSRPRSAPASTAAGSPRGEARRARVRPERNERPPGRSSPGGAVRCVDRRQSRRLRPSRRGPCRRPSRLRASGRPGAVRVEPSRGSAFQPMTWTGLPRSWLTFSHFLAQESSASETLPVALSK